ncbi:MAG: FecR family protein [Acidovorax sp.]|uniref:FecR family protein n=1 Tax=Acidovorax sp. TaxID=1872122 RepID=UPI00391A5907
MIFPVPPSPEDASGLRRDVLDWFIRRHRGEWGGAEEAAFQDWLAADTAHRETYADWESNWKALDLMPAETVSLLRRNLQRDKDQQAVNADVQSLPRRRSNIVGSPLRRFIVPLFAAASFAVVTAGSGVVAWNLWQARPDFVQAYSTPRGEQTEVLLPDGSRLKLDTATRLEVAYYRQRREVKLLEGQAVFGVQADAKRPFHVLAGPVDVAVVGTRFSVRYTPSLPEGSGVRVSVEEGRVRVAPLDDRAPAGAVHGAPEGAVYLTAGQQVFADAQGALAPVMPVPNEGIAPWRKNRISFVNTPLVQALAELERYGSTGLRVRDPAVGALRLTGTFDPRDAQTLQRVLPGALPVRLQQVGGVTEVVLVR